MAIADAALRVRFFDLLAAAADPATARQLFLAILRTDVNFGDVAQRVRSTSGATPNRPAAPREW